MTLIARVVAGTSYSPKEDIIICDDEHPSAPACSCLPQHCVTAAFTTQFVNCPPGPWKVASPSSLLARDILLKFKVYRPELKAPNQKEEKLQV